MKPDNAIRPPARPSGLHPASTDYLRGLYRAWLASHRPHAPEHGVASPRNQRSVARGAAWAEATASAWADLKACFEQTPDRVWAWSDLHLGHETICKKTNRPFASARQMNGAFLAAAQACVKPDDWLVFLGDVSFLDADQTRSWLTACPGRKALLLGNHDGDTPWARSGISAMDLGFDAAADAVDWHLDTPFHDANAERVERLWLTHYPLWHDWIPPGTRNVHGHIHQFRIGGRLINASVEQTGFAPVRLQALAKTPQTPFSGS